MIPALLLLASTLHPLTYSAWLTQHAEIRAQQICDSGEFSHHLFWTTQTWDFGHLKYAWIGENLAQGFGDDATTTNNAWLASPGHRANMADPKYQRVGIAHLACPAMGGVTVALYGGF